jgi:hypothetical protein
MPKPQVTQSDASLQTIIGAQFGYCPQCGAPGQTRERRLYGNDKCGNGHIYPSGEAISIRAK